MITVRGFTITYKNAAFLGLGFCLGYAKALADSEEVLARLDLMIETINERIQSEDPEAAEEAKAKAEAIPGTAVEIIPEIEAETP